ncbi:MAG TPA: hypothetical protein PK069_08195 [Methanolinea sp.]|nr:hypothetical protein [Methanolinea sp.]HQK56344.1 hypothetical protein [Methanolinea sp.]
MDLREFQNLNAVKSRLLKIAAGGVCEHCGEAYPFALLEIHAIYPRSRADTACPDLQKEVLILCPECHRFFHARPVQVSIQRQLVRYRPKKVKTAMRQVLGYQPRSYVPPETNPPDAIFREMFESGALDLCLNGG